MNLTGYLKIKEKLIGNIHLLKKVHGYSAYDLAVKYGYKGTEEEWLQSLKGPKGDPGTLENHTEIDALGHRVVNVAEPEEDTDGANKKYVDDNCKGFVSSAVEDISEDYIAGNPIAGFVNVYKQGNVISGTILVLQSFTKNNVLFTINEKYRPKAYTFTPCITLQGYVDVDTIEDIPTGEVVIRYIDGAFKVTFTETNEELRGRIVSAFLTFTYICN